jgi:DNA-directed RNA polymerase sigma subunit (sigma70/sigma32)
MSALRRTTNWLAGKSVAGEVELPLGRCAIEDPFDVVADKMEIEQLRVLLPALPQREYRILDLRYGLEQSRAHAWSEIAGVLGCSTQTVRLVHAQALDRLRRRWAGPKKPIVGEPRRRAA